MPTTPAPLATTDDVADMWRPLNNDEYGRIQNLIVKASAALRQTCPFDVDDRITQWTADPTQPLALDPELVATVVATVVKRFLVNVEGVASSSDGLGPFSHSATYVNRYDKTGSDVRGAIQVTDGDIAQLLPKTPFAPPSSFKIGVPCPEILVPGWGSRRSGRLGAFGGVEPAIVPDIAPGSGAE